MTLQEPDRPDLHLLLRAVLVLLADVRDTVREPGAQPDLAVRAGALHAVVRRFMDGDSDDC